eukprot:COSAG04_NODE_1074_length_8447_cov_4.858409_6_plen_367_part_00
MLSDAVPVVEADWGEGQEEEAARYFSFGPSGEQDFFDAADNAAIAHALANGDAAVRLPPKPFGTFEIRFGASATTSRLTTPPKSGMLQVNLANQNSREVRKWDPELGGQTKKVVTVSASAVHTANPASRLAAETKGFPLSVDPLTGGSAEVIAARRTTIHVTPRMKVSEVKALVRAALPQREPYLSQANELVVFKNNRQSPVSERVLVEARGTRDHHSRRPARVCDTQLSSNTIVSLRKKPTSTCWRWQCGGQIFCCCFLVCQPDDEPATVCFKLMVDLAVLGALGFVLFVVFIIASLTILGGLGGHCGRRMLVGAEDLLWSGSGWLVGQDIVRLEACGRPFIEGGQAMMAAAVEAVDSDWWSAEL